MTKKWPPHIVKIRDRATMGDKEAALQLLRWLAYRTLDKRKIAKIQRDRAKENTR